MFRWPTPHPSVIMPPAVGGIKRCRGLSVPPSLGAARIGQLGAQGLVQATRAVRTADPSAHGRRSAAIDGWGAYRLADSGHLNEETEPFGVAGASADSYVVRLTVICQ